jgi:hypothetical protein
MGETEGLPPEGSGVRYYSDDSTADLVGPDDVGRELDVLDAPGGAAVGRADLAGWALDGLGRREATWCLTIGGMPMPVLYFLRGGEFVPDAPAPAAP